MVLVLLSSVSAPLRERFRPKEVKESTHPKVEFAYLDEEKTMVVYFADRPRLDYRNFSEKEYEKLLHSKDNSAYYFEHIHGKIKP